MLEIINKKGSHRIGRFKTKSGVVNTPFFMPIATRGAVKMIETKEIKEIGFEVILGNTYHLWMKPGDELVDKAGGLHNFMNWDGSILTDSGGFQVFSLGVRAKTRFGKSGVKLSEEGVSFVDPVSGEKRMLAPEKSIDIQLNLGSDMIMCLDECPPYPCDHRYAKRSLERTTRWAERCFSHFHKRVKEREDKYEKGRPMLFCIVQGSVYEDLRKESARQLLSLDFKSLGGPDSGWDGFAVGGVAVGEPREKLYEILEWVVPLLPEDRPRYLMGLGRPDEILAAVKAGVDMFDCVIPTREGRHGRAFVWSNEDCNPNGDFYKTINITNGQYREDFTPIDSHCNCPVCKKYSKAYIRHLFSVNEALGMKFVAVHNLFFYYQMMKRLKEY